jgi:hypothetical protein
MRQRLLKGLVTYRGEIRKECWIPSSARNQGIPRIQRFYIELNTLIYGDKYWLSVTGLRATGNSQVPSLVSGWTQANTGVNQRG